MAKKQRRRRWFQFSLRGLLAMVAVLGVWLSVEVNSAKNQREAVDQIRAWGGKVEYDEPPPDQPESSWRSWRRRLFGKDAVSNVVSVKLPPSKATFQSKAPPGPWPGPSPFTEGPAVDDEGLRVVARLKKLEHLDLSWTDVSDVGLGHLGRLKMLRQLYLYKTRITDAGLIRLRGLKRLEQLGVSGKSISDAGLAHLAGLCNLRCLVLDDTSVSSHGLMQLKCCAMLKYVSMVRCANVGDDGLSSLGLFSKLIEADLRETSVTAQGVAKLRSRLPVCTIRF
jgi:hypothetical protein